MKPRTTAAIQSVQQLLHDHNIETDRCEILQEASTLVLRLSEDLVGRVILDSEGIREGTDFFERETRVVEYLARQGAPVVGVHAEMPPGPFVKNGFVMNFWRFVHAEETLPNAEEVGASLARCHHVLKLYDGKLDALAILEESLSLIPKLRSKNLLSKHTSLLEQSLHRTREILQQLSLQPVHGDAHWGNVLRTSDGPIWMDWEDVFLGPVEWDLASILWNHKFLDNDEATVSKLLAAYQQAGGSWNEEVMEVCYEARAAVIAVWYPFLYPEPNQERQSKLEARLSFVQKRLRES